MEPNDEQLDIEVREVGLFDDLRCVRGHLGNIREHLTTVACHLVPRRWLPGCTVGYWRGFVAYPKDGSPGRTAWAGYGWTRARARAAFLRRWRDRDREES